MKKFLLLYTTPLVAAILVVIKIQPVEEYIKNINEHAPLIIGILLVVLILWNHFLNVFSPFKKYEKWAKNKWFILNKEAEKLHREYKKGGVEINMNIMVPVFKMMYRIEPSAKDKSKTKISFADKVFKDVWSYPNQVNKLFKITVNQGICGKTYRQAVGILTIDFVTNNASNFNLTKKQEELTKDLIFIASCPITALEEGSEEQVKKIIGIVNIESSTKGAEKVLQNPALKDELTSQLLSFSEICSKLL